MIEGINDLTAHAQELEAIAVNLRAKINLIPLNKVEGCNFLRPSHEKCLRFEKELKKCGANVTFRYEKGSTINAACGQLRAAKLKPNKNTNT